MESKPPPPPLVLKRSRLYRWNGKKYELESETTAPGSAGAANQPQAGQEPPTEDDEEVGFGDWKPEDPNW